MRKGLLFTLTEIRSVYVKALSSCFEEEEKGRPCDGGSLMGASPEGSNAIVNLHSDSYDNNRKGSVAGRVEYQVKSNELLCKQ